MCIRDSINTFSFRCRARSSQHLPCHVKHMFVAAIPVSYTHLDVYKRQQEYYVVILNADTTKEQLERLSVSQFQLSLIHI